MKLLLSIAKYVLIGIYAVCGVLLLVFLLPNTGWKALNVTTGSMAPAIPAGSLVVINRTAPSQLATGDVVTYINPANTRETITHRITEVTKQGNIPAFITKGDANNAPDKQILGGNVVGRVEWHAPYVGKALGWARHPIGLILLVLIPGVLIIISEVRLLNRKLAKKPFELEPKPNPIVPAKVEPKRPAKKPPKPRGPGMDGILRAVLVCGLVFGVGIGATKAVLSSVVTLSNNTISVDVPQPVDHLLIDRVILGGLGQTCPQVNPAEASIFNTAPGSINQIIISNQCRIRIHNGTTVVVNNNSSQSGQTGDSTNSGNADGSNASSGNAANSNSTATSVNVNNAGGVSQWVVLYNPTASPINVKDWTLSDDVSSKKLPNRTIAAGAYLFINVSSLNGQGDGLEGAGDRLTLQNPANAIIDAISWGSDTTILSPAIPAIPAGGQAYRQHAGIDTDSANDWVVEGP